MKDLLLACVLDCHPIDHFDLVNLKAWWHQSQFVSKDASFCLPYGKLAVEALTPGFGFDGFGLKVREKFAIASTA